MRKTMRVLTAIACMAVFAGTASGLDRPRPLKVGDKAPPVVATWLSRVQGKDPSKADGKTKAYIVEFWATWCEPCLYVIPELNNIHRNYAKRGVVVMGITDESASQVRPFMQEHGMTYAVGVDRNDITWDGYMVGINRATIPHAVVVDGNGRVAWIGSPLDPETMTINAEMFNTMRRLVYGPETLKRIQDAEGRLAAALEKRDLDGALAAVNDLIRLQPDSLNWHDGKVYLLERKGAGEREIAAAKEARRRAAGEE